ncbi:MAG TPA: nuclear transport factor 2 family protein [Acidimicrobiales bacterium]|jgi:hypothetical protein|nr:nuclear transport factor 2 family protein [Acidimicrobiales bacterium]
MTTADDRWGVLDTVTRYFTAIDRRDFELLRDVFTPDVEAVYEGVSVAGGIDRLLAFVTGVSDIRLPVDVIDLQLSMHFVGNHVAAIEGDTARCETYALAHLVDRPAGGTRMRTRGLRYQDELVRTPGGWRIAAREHICDWMRRDGFEWAADAVTSGRLVAPPS